jgi:hypothetical protein
MNCSRLASFLSREVVCVVGLVLYSIRVLRLQADRGSGGNSSVSVRVGYGSDIFKFIS